MPNAGWTVMVLLDTAVAERQALTLALSVMLALGLGAWRRRRSGNVAPG
jgi:hypothetical protein